MLDVDKLKDLAGKIDRKALAGAVGLMLLSWGALPVIYWLIVNRKKDDRKDTPTSLDIKPSGGRGDTPSDSK